MIKKLFLPILLALLFFSFTDRDQVEPGLVTAYAKAASLKAGDLKCAPAHVTLSPCDQSFNFKVTRGGSPDFNPFNYWIFQGMTMVDSGTITYGNNTNPVLNYCTEYLVAVYDWCSGKIQITITSDGCNNTFLC